MNKDKCQWEIVLNLLRYLPTSLSSTEYYVVKHDDACPRIDRSMLEDFDEGQLEMRAISMLRCCRLTG